MQLQAVARGAAVRRQWRHILAVLARYRAIAQVAVLTAEAAAMSRMEAERSKAEAEWEGMAAALIWQAVRRAQETEAKAVARRLVVVDASDEDADAATQTDPVQRLAHRRLCSAWGGGWWWLRCRRRFTLQTGRQSRLRR